MMILTVKSVWLDGLYKSGKIVYISNSSALAQRNIKSIIELETLELFMYLVRTYVISVNSSRLNELATSLKMSACMEWWEYDGF